MAEIETDTNGEVVLPEGSVWEKDIATVHIKSDGTWWNTQVLGEDGEPVGLVIERIVWESRAGGDTTAKLYCRSMPLDAKMEAEIVMSGEISPATDMGED